MTASNDWRDASWRPQDMDLRKALDRHVAAFKPFTLKPMGQAGSSARAYTERIDREVRERRTRKALRAAFAVECPRCTEYRPRVRPAKLLPGQRCGLDGYTDPRPKLTAEQRRAAYRAAGLAMQPETTNG